MGLLDSACLILLGGMGLLSLKCPMEHRAMDLLQPSCLMLHPGMGLLDPAMGKSLHSAPARRGVREIRRCQY